MNRFRWVLLLLSLTGVPDAGSQPAKKDTDDKETHLGADALKVTREVLDAAEKGFKNIPKEAEKLGHSAGDALETAHKNIKGAIQGQDAKASPPAVTPPSSSTSPSHAEKPRKSRKPQP